MSGRKTDCETLMGKLDLVSLPKKRERGFFEGCGYGKKNHPWHLALGAVTAKAGVAVCTREPEQMGFTGPISRPVFLDTSSAIGSRSFSLRSVEKQQLLARSRRAAPALCPHGLICSRVGASAGGSAPWLVCTLPRFGGQPLGAETAGPATAQLSARGPRLGPLVSSTGVPFDTLVTPDVSILKTFNLLTENNCNLQCFKYFQ